MAKKNLPTEIPQEKEQVVVWIDVGDAHKVQKIKNFIPVYDYKNQVNPNPYEWGMVKQKDLIIRFRATTCIREMRRLFNE